MDENNERIPILLLQSIFNVWIIDWTPFGPGYIGGCFSFYALLSQIIANMVPSIGVHFGDRYQWITIASMTAKD